MGHGVHQIFGIKVNTAVKAKAGHASLFDKQEKAEMKYFHSLEAAQDYQQAHPELSRERIAQFNAVHDYVKWMIFPAYSYQLRGGADNYINFYALDLSPNIRTDGSFRMTQTDCYATLDTKRKLLSQRNSLVEIKLDFVAHENYDATVSLADKDTTGTINYIYVDNYGDCWAVDFINKNAKLEDRQTPGLQWDDSPPSVGNC